MAECLRLISLMDSSWLYTKTTLVSPWIIKHIVVFTLGIRKAVNRFYLFDDMPCWSILERSLCWIEVWGGHLQALTALLVLAKFTSECDLGYFNVFNFFSLCPSVFFSVCRFLDSAIHLQKEVLVWRNILIIPHFFLFASA